MRVTSSRLSGSYTRSKLRHERISTYYQSFRITSIWTSGVAIRPRSSVSYFLLFLAGIKLTVRRQVERKRGVSAHRRQSSPGHDLFVEDHEMGEPPHQRPNVPNQQATRGRAATIRGEVGLSDSTRVNHPKETGDHDMRDVPQQPTRGRSTNLASRSGAGFGDHSNTNLTQGQSAPQRGQAPRSEDHRQNRSVISSRRNLPDEYEETDRDEIEVPETRMRGRSRAPSRHPDAFRSEIPTAQELGRGRPTGPTRNQVYNQVPHQEDPERPPAQDDRAPNQRYREDRRPTHDEIAPRAQSHAPIGYRGSVVPRHVRDDHKITRSRSVEPPKGLHEVLVNQMVSAINEENCVLVSPVSFFHD